MADSCKVVSYYIIYNFNIYRGTSLETIILDKENNYDTRAYSH